MTKGGHKREALLLANIPNNLIVTITESGYTLS